MIFSKKSSEEIEELNEQIEKLESQNKILLETLNFYASENNWVEGHKYRDADDATIFTEGSQSAATVDSGKKALRILNKIKKG